MRFHEDHAAKWAPRPTFKSRREDAGRVVHHNALNTAVPSRDEEARSREVERFFDVMTAATKPRDVERP